MPANEHARLLQSPEGMQHVASWLSYRFSERGLDEDLWPQSPVW